MGSELSDEMTAVMVCSKMGWTYTEYINQPDWFISALLIKWGCDIEEKYKQHGQQQ